MLHTTKITDTSAAWRPSQPPHNTSGTQGNLPGGGWPGHKRSLELGPSTSEVYPFDLDPKEGLHTVTFTLHTIPLKTC